VSASETKVSVWGATPAALAVPCLYESAVLQAVAGGCRRPGGLELTDRALRLSALPRGSRVLDVGCADGTVVEYLTLSHGMLATGVDPSTALLDEGARHRPDFDLRHGRAEKLPFADDSFDALLAECSLSLADDPARAVAECARVLRGGGRLLVSDIYRRGRPDGLRALLAEHGFDVEAWEDQSGLLARLVWNIVELHGSTAAFWEAAGVAAPPADLGDRADGPSEPARSRGLGGLGYFLCVARLGAVPAGGAGHALTDAQRMSIDERLQETP
jgi:arsenite methyltransferase